ncbi:NAD-binding protein [Candidatus Skiveiella danica]|uniref:NAD-binding protein n=1 Tax=Candidatus Skiveiella danica TaxID=3386177 RepID=UPI001D237C09|nr:NAD-binding protein [Betaproteobacteria bacterium]
MDVVGSVLERASLDKARVREASAVVLALSDDSESVFATAVVRDYAPGVPLIVRVLRTPSPSACTARARTLPISVGQVAGQILAYHLLGEQTTHVENRVKFIRVNAGCAGR